MARYYVVWKGRRPGVYETWESCEGQVKGYKGAEYNSYKTLGEAAEAYKSGPERKSKTEREGERKNAGARASKRPSRPLVPDDPENYPEDVKETLRRVLGR